MATFYLVDDIANFNPFKKDKFKITVKLKLTESKRASNSPLVNELTMDKQWKYSSYNRCFHVFTIF